MRVMRACRELGLRSVAVYSEIDRAAPHVRYADEAYPIGTSPPADSYLRIDRIIDVARRAGATAVHPGYGFLAENPEFADACRGAGLTFVGPSADVIALMGGKTEARKAARRAGVPIVPGTDAPLKPDLPETDVADIAAGVGYPLLVKAVAGGGGKGMRLVHESGDLASALRLARSEAASAFGDAAVYFERQLCRPRHVEVQLLADEHGTVVPFVERECSIQRRHQKVVEEAPSTVVSPARRAQMAEAAASIARGVGYTNAGTVEFLLDETGKFYFLEMNTRLQVEHAVTEMVTRLDLVHWQFRIARGERLTIDPGRALTPQGHAIECRVYAEDPDASFMPSPGVVLGLRPPSGPGIRDDSGVAPGLEVPVDYDPLISKVVAWGEHRAHAIARMTRAMDEYEVDGIKTTIPFFRWLLRNQAFCDGGVDTTFVDAAVAERGGRPFVEASSDTEEVAVMAAALHAFFGAGGDPSRASAPAASGWRRLARAEGLRT